MDERLRALIDQIPDKPPRSKLEPHLDVIRELRRKGRTYQEIAQFFGEHLNVTVAASTIHAFVQVRARRRKQRPQIELPPATTEPAEAAPAGDKGWRGARRQRCRSGSKQSNGAIRRRKHPSQNSNTTRASLYRWLQGRTKGVNQS